MKIPKSMRRYCPYCKKHTEHKVAQAKGKTHGTAKPLSKYGKKRAGFKKGYGNLGRYGSKPPITKFKMAGKKSTKKTDLRYTCKTCNKTHTQKRGIRAKKVEFV